MVARKLNFILILTFFFSFPLIINANPSADQWIETNKSYKDLINEGFEVKSYAVSNIETANGLYVLLFITVLQKNNEIYECQEYQTIDKEIKTLDMTLICKELVQPYEKGLGT